MYEPHSRRPRVGAGPRRHLASPRAGPSWAGAAGDAAGSRPERGQRGGDGGGELLPQHGVWLGSGALR